MRIVHNTLIVTCLVALAAFVLPASAAVPPYAELTTQLTGGLGTFDLYTRVDQLDPNLYMYSYQLTFTDATLGENGEPLVTHVFSVENVDNRAFSAAANTNDFTNPTFGTYWFEVKWINGNLYEGETMTFSYESAFGPSEVPVSTYAVNGGAGAAGTTLGIAAAEIPEPGALAALATGLIGLVPIIRRRR